jgi:large subunit ribosomal protein L4
MTTVDLRRADGSSAGTVALDDAVFGVQPNVPLLHQVVTAQLAAARRGTHSTLTRAEVRGGGSKPYRQKGTGRARQGSTRAPHWEGGGIALGPKPRSYRQRTPKKMVKLALACALSDRARDGKVVVVEAWAFTEARTKEAVAALQALGLEGEVVVVVAPEDATTIRAFRNLPSVHLLLTTELNAYDILCSDWVVFTSDTLPGGADVEPAAPTEAVAAEPAPPTEPPAPVEAVAAEPAAPTEPPAVEPPPAGPTTAGADTAESGEERPS